MGPRRRARPRGSRRASRTIRPARDDRLFLAIATRNRPAWLMADLAALLRGYVSVPVAPDDPEERTARVLELARPAALVCEGGDADRLAGLAPWARLVVVCEDGDDALRLGLAAARPAQGERENAARSAPTRRRARGCARS
ncbi:MAG: AMP-binding protein [Kofleriaceae bacterium]|nr:AMP-binding protein [Kofleriaceae bacterium]